jgi:hypothetical protein
MVGESLLEEEPAELLDQVRRKVMEREEKGEGRNLASTFFRLAAFRG